ncbi:MAG TPA: hypothetical protein VFG10_00915 [Saprospiraceae bacterium]|nr:hypothetical protein [Saprospiraceae bacterium]
MKDLTFLCLILLLVFAGCKQSSKPETVSENDEVKMKAYQDSLIRAYQDSLKSETNNTGPTTQPTAPKSEPKAEQARNKGKYGTITRAWINLDANNRFHFKPWFGKDYIYFDRVYMDDPENPDVAEPGFQDDVYLLSDQAMLDAWNAAIRDTTIDKSKLEVGICSKIERRNNMSVFDKAALYYDTDQIYPPLTVCNCLKGCN